MLIYILIDLILILLGLLAYQKTEKRAALAAAFLLLLLVAGLRGDFTSDYGPYAAYFLKTRNDVSVSEILNLDNSYSMERIFVLLLRLIGFVTDSPVILFSILSAVTLGLYFSAFRKLSPLPLLAVLLFVSVGEYYATFNLVRQTLAAAIGFAGMGFLSRGKPGRFLLCALLAALFHKTALVLLPLCLLMQIPVSRWSMLLFAVMGIGGFALAPKIVSIIQVVFSLYDNYSYGMGEGTINAVLPSLGMLVFALYSLCLGDCELDLRERGNRMMVNGAILAAILLFLGMRIYILSRLAYYLKPCFCILIPRIIDGFRDEKERRIILIAICLLAIAFNYITLSGTGYDPYYTSFS